MIYGGQSFVSSPPAFSNDAEKLLVCKGETVSVFSTSTGMQITELVGHTAPVSSVVVVPSTSKVFCYCWTSSLDGTMRYWDFMAADLVQTIDIKLPIHSMIIPSFVGKQAVSVGKMDNVFAYVSVEVSSGHKNKEVFYGQVRRCSLIKGRTTARGNLTEIGWPAHLTVSPSGHFFGIHVKHTLQIWKVPTKDDESSFPKKIRLHHTKEFASMAFHPTENIVAAGDVTGRILVWRGFGARNFSNNEQNDELLMCDDSRPGVRDDDDADSCSTWHWHSGAVKVLAFSSDGAYLYSGGREGVLVLWQLDTGAKKFLPRIGSPLVHFVDSPDPLYSSISCADNQIHLLKMPSLEIMKSISGIKLPFEFPDTSTRSSGSYVFDHGAGLVGLTTENYCIQFYSLLDNREISEVQVCERNHQPADDITMAVNLVALSPDGCMMITVETRLPEDGVGGLICLRFWATKLQKKDFKLSTIVYEPHRDAAISDIAFNPGGNMAVSASYGGDFKIWVQDDKDPAPEIAGWTCHAVGSYKKKPMTAAAYSADGSVLAVAAETVLTLWDPDRNVLVAVIEETFMPIHKLSFVGKSEYLISASGGSSPQFSVWNLSTLSLAWSYKLCVQALACTDDGTSFAVLSVLPNSSNSKDSYGNPSRSRDGIILLFDAKKPVPTATWSAKKANGGGLAFLRPNASMLEMSPSSGTQLTTLVYIDGHHEYVVFDPYNKDATKIRLNRQGDGGIEPGTACFGYTALFGELKDSKLKKDRGDITIVPSDKPWETLFSGSTLSLPPLTKLCPTFLESLLEKRTAPVE